MSIVLLRTLTRQSFIKFGNYRDYKVQDLLNQRLEREVISMYYNLGNISFTPDILEELGITGELVIAKPGSCRRELHPIFEKTGNQMTSQVFAGVYDKINADPEKKIQRIKEIAWANKNAKVGLKAREHGNRLGLSKGAIQYARMQRHDK